MIQNVQSGQLDQYLWLNYPTKYCKYEQHPRLIFNVYYNKPMSYNLN